MAKMSSLGAKERPSQVLHEWQQNVGKAVRSVSVVVVFNVHAMLMTPAHMAEREGDLKNKHTKKQ